MPKVTHQTATGDIINTVGDAIFNNPILQVDKEVHDSIQKTQQQQLERLLEGDPLSALHGAFDASTSVSREEVLRNLTISLSDHKKVALIGDPGIGKSFVLQAYAQEHDNYIYVSLKHTSPKQTIQYLLNTLRTRRGVALSSLEREESLALLQAELVSSSSVFLIDDCEADDAFTQELLRLIPYDSKFLFASRDRSPFVKEGIQIYELLGFTKEHTREFISLQPITVSETQFIDLYIHSNGNPLYLTLFSQHQIDPLPQSLHAYQRAIWENLDSEKKMLMGCIAIPLFRLSIPVLKDALERYTGTSLSSFELVEKLKSLDSLVVRNEGFLAIFHPYFSEFIVVQLHAEGLYSELKKILGEAFLNNEDFVEASWLLYDQLPEKVDQYILEVVPELLDSGLIQKATTLLKWKRENSKEPLEKGMACYFLGFSTVTNEINKSQRLEYSQEAVSCFEEAKKNELVLSAKMIVALNFINFGKEEEGLTIIEEILPQIEDQNPIIKGQLLINLSSAYVRTNDFDRAAEFSKAAFEVFNQEDHHDGMIASLVNLTNCLVQIDELKLAEEYLEVTLGYVDHQESIIYEVIVLNGAISLYRRLGRYQDALLAGEKVVEICKKHGFQDKLLINLINVGNVHRDLTNIDKAVEYYEEAIVLSEQQNDPSSEARARWILAQVKRKQGKFDESITQAEQAIIVGLEANDSFSLANSYDELGETLENKGRTLEAAEAFMNSGNAYTTHGSFHDSALEQYCRAFSLFMKGGDTVQAYATLEQISSSYSAAETGRELADHIEEDRDGVAMYIKLYENFVTTGDTSNLAHVHLHCISYCKSLAIKEGVLGFKKILGLLLEQPLTPNRGILIALSFEQSGEFLSQQDLFEYLDILSCKIEGLFFRVSYDFLTITFFIEDLELQFQVDKQDLTAFKLILGVIVILETYYEYFFNTEQKNPEAPGIIFSFLEYDEHVKELIPENYFEGDIQTVITETSETELPTYIFIGREYEIASSFTLNRNSKTFTYFVMTFLDVIFQRSFGKESINHDAVFRSQLIAKVSELFGMSIDTGAAEAHQVFKVDSTQLGSLRKKQSN